MPQETEYRQKFRRNLSCHQNYKEMLRIRQHRKTLDHHHTPITWDSDSENENENNIPVKKSDMSNIRQCTSKAKILNEISTQTDQVNSKSVAVQSPSKVVSVRDVSVQSPPRNEKLIPNSSVNKSKRRLSKRKSVSTRKSTPKRKCSEPLHKDPIIPYGWADDTSIQRKKTFNVRAPSAHVKPTALQAEKIRNFNKKTKLTRREKLEAEKRKREAAIESLTNFNQWQSEYQCQFCK